MPDITCPHCGMIIHEPDYGGPYRPAGEGLSRQRIILSQQWRIAFNFHPCPSKWMEVADSWELPWVEQYVTAENLKNCESEKGQYFGPNSFASWLRRREKHVRPPGERTPAPDPFTMFGYLECIEREEWFSKASKANPDAPKGTLKALAVELWQQARQQETDDG